MFSLQFPLKFQQYAGIMLVAILAFIAFQLHGDIRALLITNQQTITQLQVWRLITGAFLHTNEYHLLLNCGGLVLLWALHGDHYRLINFTSIFVFSAGFTGLGIVLFNPEMNYVGLSGALHGLFAWGAVKDITVKMKSGWVLLFGLYAKLTWEQFSGASADVAALIQANVAVDSHLYGAIAGTIIALASTMKKGK